MHFGTAIPKVTNKNIRSLVQIYLTGNRPGYIPIGDWNVSDVESMFFLFSGYSNFNEPLTNWDTSNVTNMAGMFHNASSFNQPLNHFNTGKVTNMTSMFENAYNFNQPLNNWDVSNVTSTAEMFKNASSFLQSLSNWQIEPNTNTENMYKNSPMSGRIDLRPSVEQKGRTEKGKKRALEFEVELENRKKMPKTFFDEDEIPVCICGDKLDNIEGPTEFPIEIQQNPRGKPIEPKDVIRVCGSDATHFLHRGCAMSWKHSNDRHERSETQEKTDLCPICLTKMGNLRYTKTVDINEVKEVTNSKNKKALSNQKAGKQSCKQTRKYRKNKNKRRNTRRYK